eukprot:TRINITY_DN2375_c0_g1_i2.p1 TRINITY_DN2375_c0_g1~~TRINITY_DN2375_c0_g1_i2.p1  ORF type:complete len:259 (-),score=105.58 TRINITY_DN2375_c0_g1_i2:362-1138(-)
MDNNFLTNGGKNKFFDEEVDDDEFLRHPKSGSSGYMLPHQAPTLSNNSRHSAQQSLEQQRQQLVQRRREVEERTLASSERGLGLLYESEKVGVATAEELSRQKEQLMMTEQKLDDINSTLRNSEKHIQGVRSVFGSIRNYFSGHSTTAPPPSHPAPQLRTSTSTSSLPHQQQAYQDHHPGLRNKPGLIQKPAGSVDEALDRNLDDMASGLARLKGLAQGLNSELSDHNQILDRVTDKTEVVGFKVDKQNKDMNKILKK